MDVVCLFSVLKCLLQSMLAWRYSRNRCVFHSLYTVVYLPFYVVGYHPRGLVACLVTALSLKRESRFVPRFAAVVVLGFDFG